MFQPLTTNNPSYLIELFNPVTKELEETDICKKLAVAIDKAYDHLNAFSSIIDNIDVSFDAQGQVEGIGFFDEKGGIVTCITTYHLDKDTDEPKNIDVLRACEGPKELLQQQMFKIFN